VFCQEKPFDKPPISNRIARQRNKGYRQARSGPVVNLALQAYFSVSPMFTWRVMHRIQGKMRWNNRTTYLQNPEKMTTHFPLLFDAGGRLCASITSTFEIISRDGLSRA
jgi:hypothetical protein